MPGPLDRILQLTLDRAVVGPPGRIKEVLADDVFVAISGTYERRLVDFLNHAVNVEQGDIREQVIQENFQVFPVVFVLVLDRRGLRGIAVAGTSGVNSGEPKIQVTGHREVVLHTSAEADLDPFDSFLRQPRALTDIALAASTADPGETQFRTQLTNYVRATSNM